MGAAISALLASLGVGLEVNLILFAAIGLVLAMWAGAGMIEDEPAQTPRADAGGRFSLPPRALWALGVIAFCGAVGEGSMADWGALYIHDELSVGNDGLAAFGFTVFSATMLAGRFASDKLSIAMGAARLVRYGSLVSAAGLMAGLLADGAVGAIVGFAIMGIGLASLFPVVYSAAGSIPGIPSGRGVAAVATIVYTGFLAGPPVLGVLAHETSIRVSLMVVAALIAVVPFFSGTLDRNRPAKPGDVSEPIPES